MKPREFEKYMKTCTVRGKLNVTKLLSLSPEIRKEMVLILVKLRMPVVYELSQIVDRAWLAAMGYLYTTKGKEYTFVHLSNHKIL